MGENWKKEGFEWLKAIVITLIIFVVIQTFFFTNYQVKGQSMDPTLHDGNKLFINKIGYEPAKLKRFEVIVFHANDKDDYVKRVIGLPGDTIEYKDDILYINGTEVEEPYLEKQKQQLYGEKLTGDFTLLELTGEERVPEGKIFVLGDNRRNSTDSRHLGLFDLDSVVGKVNFRYWPIQEFGVRF